MDSKISYHLRELELARNPQSHHNALPEFSKDHQSILDIGCGIGQTLVVSRREDNKLLVGMDIDMECLSYGRSQFDEIKFINGTAEQLPFQNQSFDFVISRVALPYTNIPQSLAEISRVLKKNGTAWITLHTFSLVANHLVQSIKTFRFKDVIYRTYVLANGIFFHFFGRLFSLLPGNRYESFQTASSMEKCMKQAGFIDISVQIDGDHFLCTARKGEYNEQRSLT